MEINWDVYRDLKKQVQTYGLTPVLGALCAVVEHAGQEDYIKRLYCDLWRALDNYELRYSFARKMGNDHE